MVVMMKNYCENGGNNDDDDNGGYWIMGPEDGTLPPWNVEHKGRCPKKTVLFWTLSQTSDPTHSLRAFGTSLKMKDKS